MKYLKEFKQCVWVNGIEEGKYEESKVEMNEVLQYKLKLIEINIAPEGNNLCQNKKTKSIAKNTNVKKRKKKKWTINF